MDTVASNPGGSRLFDIPRDAFDLDCRVRFCHRQAHFLLCLIRRTSGISYVSRLTAEIHWFGGPLFERTLADQHASAELHVRDRADADQAATGRDQSRAPPRLPECRRRCARFPQLRQASPFNLTAVASRACRLPKTTG